LIAHYVANTTQQALLYSAYYPPSDFPPYSFDETASYNSYQLAWWTMNGDVCVQCPTLKMAEQISANKAVPEMFVYDFKGPGLDGLYYAPHAAELPFVFNEAAILETMFFKIPWNQSLSDSMQSAWVNMARYGTPNISNDAGEVELIWNAFDAETESVLLFQGGEIGGDDGIQNVANFGEEYRSNVCDFWYNEVGEEIMVNLCWNGFGSLDEDGDDAMAESTKWFDIDLIANSDGNAITIYNVLLLMVCVGGIGVLCRDRCAERNNKTQRASASYGEMYGSI